MDCAEYQPIKNPAPPTRYWLYPGKGMPENLFHECCRLLGLNEEQIIAALAESKALIFTLGPGPEIGELEFEHDMPNVFETAPAGTQLSKLFDGWNYYLARITSIATCELVDRRSPPRPFMK